MRVLANNASTRTCSAAAGSPVAAYSSVRLQVDSATTSETAPDAITVRSSLRPPRSESTAFSRCSTGAVLWDSPTITTCIYTAPSRSSTVRAYR